MSPARAVSADATLESPKGLWRAALPIVLSAGALGCLALLSLIDRPLALELHGLSGISFIHVAALVSDLGQAQWWLVPSLLVFVSARFLWRSPEGAARALFVFVSVASVGLATDVLKVICGRARPQL